MEWVIAGIGVGILIFGGWLTVRPNSLTMAHAVICAIGAGLIVLPQLTNFEISDGSIKFTTRTQGAELVGELKSVTEQQEQLAKNISDIGKAMESMSREIAEVKQAIAKNQPDTSFEVEPGFPPDFWKGLATEGGNLREQSQKAIQRLDGLRQSIEGGGVSMPALER